MFIKQFFASRQRTIKWGEGRPGYLRQALLGGGLFILFWGLSGLYLHYDYMRMRNLALDNLAQEQQRLWTATLKEQGRVLQAYVEGYIFTDAVVGLLQETLNGTAESWRSVRTELYATLNDFYLHVLKKNGIQLHFYSHDGHSLLRFHAPERFADPLPQTQSMLAHVMQHHKNIQGFEGGSFADGYRALFPIIINGQYLGSVELTRPFSALCHTMCSHYTATQFVLVRHFHDGNSSLDGVLKSDADFIGKQWLVQTAVSGTSVSDLHKIPDWRPVFDSLDYLAGLLDRGMAQAFVVNDGIEPKTVTMTPIFDFNGELFATLISLRNSDPVACIQQTLGEERSLYIWFAAFLSGLILITISRVSQVKKQKQRVDMLANAVVSGIYVTNHNGTTVFVNRRASEILGYPEDEILGVSAHDLFHAHGFGWESCPVHEVILTGGEYKGEEYFRCKDGTKIPVEIAAAPIALDENEDGGIVVFDDISERKRVEIQLRKLSLAIEQNPAAVVITDLQPAIEYVNPKFTEITGFEKHEVIGKNPLILKSSQTPRDIYKVLWKRLLAGDEWHGELLNKRKDGSVFWEWVSISPLRNDQGDVTHFISVQEDITEKIKQERQLEYLATHDSLTGLGNRDLLHEYLTQAIVTARKLGRRIAVMILDLDRFKMINDSLGHAFGDNLLCQVAQRLSDLVRETDRVIRFGGDEFVILLDGIEHVKKIKNIATKVLSGVSDVYRIDAYEISLTASIGISLYPVDGLDSTTLIRNADVAMYQAKKQRNHFLFYSSNMNKYMLETLELENALRQALRRKEFCLDYQPKFNIKTGLVDGCEALLRWRHPQRGLVSPAEFIPLAEETGLIVSIGTWALREACRQSLAWQSRGMPSITIAVNLPARQFHHGNLKEVTQQALTESGLDPHLIELELTESMVMENPQAVEKTLHELKQIGVKLSLDDFGTGFSSLNYLRRFPVDHLKIDQSFIRDVMSDETGASVVTSIIDIAHNLSLGAIAEGVETMEQLNFLKASGCDVVQGFLFSKPLAPEKFYELMMKPRYFDDVINGDILYDAQRTNSDMTGR